MGDNNDNDKGGFLESGRESDARVHNMNSGNLHPGHAKKPVLSDLVEPRGMDTGTLHVKLPKPEIDAPNLSIDRSHENVIVSPPKRNPFAVGFQALMNRLRFVSDTNEGRHWETKPATPAAPETIETRSEWIDPKHAASAEKLSTLAREAIDARIAAATTPGAIKKILDTGNVHERFIPGSSIDSEKRGVFSPNQKHIDSGAEAIEALIAKMQVGTEVPTSSKSTKPPPDAGVVERNIAAYLTKPFSKQPDITAPRESQIGGVYAAVAAYPHQTIHTKPVLLPDPADEIDYEAHMGQDLPKLPTTGDELPILTETHQPGSSGDRINLEIE